MNSDSLLLERADFCTLTRQIGIDVLMDELISRLGEAIRVFDPGVGQIPPRNGVYYEQPAWGLLECMPAHLGEAGTTVKLVGYHPANPERFKLPTVLSTICVFDASTGHLEGVVDGTFLTALRTGAASAVASEILALPESATLGVIGCGAQAVTQIHALSRRFELERVIAYDLDPVAANSLQDRVAFVGLPVETADDDSLPELLRASDLLVTCTSAAPGAGPVFPDFENKPHLHVNAVGSDFHGKFEVPLALLRRSLVCPDFRGQAVDEGDCQQLEASEIGPDLRTLVQNAEEFVEARNRPTVFDSTGWALEDQVAARMVMDYAEEMKLGRRIAFECIPPDPKDPYSFFRESGVANPDAPAKAGTAVS